MTIAKNLIVRRVCLVLLVSFRWSLAMRMSDYVELISDVNDYFGTSSVFLLQGNFHDLSELKRHHEFIRLFSMREIISVHVDYDSFRNDIESRRTKFARPLFVHIFQSEDQIATFSRLVANFRMSYPIWLLIFEGDVDPTESSKMGRENIFHLRFDSEVLVFRSKSKQIEEWYWLNNETKRVDFASWDSETGLVPITSDTLWVRRKDLENTTIVVGIADDTSLTRDYRHAIAALYRMTLLELADPLNFTIQSVSLNKLSYEMYGPDQKMQINVIDLLEARLVDIAATEVILTAPRIMSVDFMHTLIVTRVRLFIKEPEIGIPWSGYLEIFSTKTWNAIGISILLTALQLTVAAALKGNRVAHDVFTGHLLLALGVYCQQGLTMPPTSWSIRVTCFFALISAVVLSAAYAATLISHLAVAHPTPHFSSLEGFLEDGSYQLILLQDSVEYDMLLNAKEKTLVKMLSLLKPIDELPTTFDEVMDQICKERVAFLNQEARMYAISYIAPCKMIGIGAEHSSNFGIAISKDNQFFGVINHHIKAMHYAGIFHRIKQSFVTEIEPPTVQFKPVSISVVTPILSVLLAGIALSIGILLIERLYAD